MKGLLLKLMLLNRKNVSTNNQKIIHHDVLVKGKWDLQIMLAMSKHGDDLISV